MARRPNNAGAQAGSESEFVRGFRQQPGCFLADGPNHAEDQLNLQRRCTLPIANPRHGRLPVCATNYGLRSLIACKISATTSPFGLAPRLPLPCRRTDTFPASLS